MPSSDEIALKIVFSNQEAIDSLSEAKELIQDAAESAPWCTELAEAIEKLTFAIEYIEVISDDDADIAFCDCEDCQAVREALDEVAEDVADFADVMSDGELDIDMD